VRNCRFLIIGALASDALPIGDSEIVVRHGPILRVRFACPGRQGPLEILDRLLHVVGEHTTRAIGIERADNQETAIAHFEAAQTVFSRDAAPDLWGQLQNNLAIVYWSRIQGNRAQNVEDAIAHFEAALTVLTQEKDPDRWAAAQNNLANAFSKRLRGQQADNREMAIAHLEAALSVFRAMPIASSGRRRRTTLLSPI